MRGQVLASQKLLHLQDVFVFTVKKLLGKIADPLVTAVIPVLVFQSLDDAPGITLNHHGSHLGIIALKAELCAGHGVGHKPDGTVQFRKLPTSCLCNIVGFRFDGIIFLQLGVEGPAEIVAHRCPKDRADAHLSHLCGFQDGR